MAELLFPFDRIDGDDPNNKLDFEEALKRFQRYGFLWIRQKNHRVQKRGSQDVISMLREIHSQNPSCLRRKWSVENTGSANQESDLSVDAVLAEHQTIERFYVSTIVSRKKDGETLDKLLTESLKPFWNDDDNTKLTTPPILGESKHNGGAWLFLGRNQQSTSKRDDAKEEPATKKPKRGGPLIGRAEHVDDVLHSGTWHVQLSGAKTWLVRPNPDSEDWEETEGGVPNLRDYIGKEPANQQPHVQVVKQSETGGPVRLCCHVQEGDLFVLNTKAWYHRTELPQDNNQQQNNNNNWSISVARDFTLPVPAVYCPKDAVEGDIILEEEDIPDRFPTAEKSSKEEVPNCAMAEVAAAAESGDASHEEPATSIVLLALRDIQKGEPLLLESVDEESDDDGDEEEEENAPESIDPRVIAKKDWREGETVLSGDAIPEDLPLSLEANCQLIEKGGELSMQSIRDIAQGEVFTIAPKEGDDLDDYEEVEVGLGHGEMTRKT